MRAKEKGAKFKAQSEIARRRKITKEMEEARLRAVEEERRK